jgi:hypothetical protein
MFSTRIPKSRGLVSGGHEVMSPKCIDLKSGKPLAAPSKELA